MVYAAGLAAEAQSDQPLCWQLLGQALDLSRATGDHRTIALCQLMLAYAPPISPLGSMARLRESAEHFEAGGDAWGTAFTVAGSGDMAMLVGDFASAEQHFDNCVRRTRARGDLRGLGQGLEALGTLVLLRNEYAQAAAVFFEAIDVCRRVNHDERIARCLRRLACIAASAMQWVLTARLLGAAAGYDLVGSTRRAATRDLYSSAADAALAHLGTAGFADAHAEGRRSALDGLLTDARQGVVAMTSRK